MQLKRIDHIGVIVDNLAEAGDMLKQTLGLASGPTIVREDLHAAFYACGDVSIEVIEILEPEARKKRLGDGKARIEHIAFEVENLSEAQQALEALGLQLTAPPRLSGGNMTFWTTPDSGDGVMYQFLQKKSAK